VSLYTIGFTKKSAEAFFLAIQGAGVRRIVDVRLNNVSQLAGFTKRDDLRYLLKAIAGINYVHMLDLAPEKHHLDEYKKGRMTWQDYEAAYLTLLDGRNVPESALQGIEDGDCLLCSEDQPEKCHRRLAAEYLARHRPGVEVIHLI